MERLQIEARYSAAIVELVMEPIRALEPCRNLRRRRIRRDHVLGGFNTFMEYTNTVGFCTSRHEMGNNVGVEWKQSAHYQNASGVRAGCPDCHVPKEWTAKLWRKIQASSELYHHIIGTIDTREKFEAKRADRSGSRA